MASSKKIRVLALGIIRQDERIFMSEGYDSDTQKTFYRAMGGGVKFGETSLAALKREFWEEIQAELTNIQYLGCMESIFVYKSKPRHEIIQLYQGDFIDSKFYQLDSIKFKEGKRQKKALWVTLEQCLSQELHIVPEQFLNYL